jgi:hypothetical protein
VVELLGVAIAAHISGNQKPDTRHDAVLKVRDSAEPLQLHRGGAIADDGLQEAPATAGRNDTGSCHFAPEASGTTDLKCLDRDQLPTVLVRTGQEEQQIFDSPNLLPGQRLAHLGAHAREPQRRLAERSLRIGRVEDGREPIRRELERGRGEAAYFDRARCILQSALGLGRDSQVDRAAQSR